MYTIGRLAARTKLNTDSVRFYERQGLLAPANKTDSGYRLYDHDTVRRIAFIKHARRCGFSLAEIKELFETYSGDPAARARGYRLAEAKLSEIENGVEALRTMAEALSYMLDMREKNACGSAMRFEEGPLMSALEAGAAAPRADPPGP